MGVVQNIQGIFPMEISCGFSNRKVKQNTVFIDVLHQTSTAPLLKLRSIPEQTFEATRIHIHQNPNKHGNFSGVEVA